MPLSMRTALPSFVVLICMLGLNAAAEQSKKVRDLTVHYSIVNSTFLQPEVAKQYDIVRSDRRAVLTVSVLNEKDNPITFPFTGSYKNLLGQVYPLKFKKIEEGSAVYYIANFRFTDQEQLRFNLEFEFEDKKETLQFSQKIYRQTR